MRHRHTVEQYGVRVEIPTEAPKISHIDTRSYHPWHARGPVLSRLSDSGGCPNANRLYARSPLPGENCQPPCGRDRNQAAAHGPLSRFRGAKDPALVTGRRHTGKPLGRPVKAFPILLPVSLAPCRSMRFGPPASRSGSPLRLRRDGRTSKCLAATPSRTRQPVKACPSETLRLRTFSPIRMSISVSYFRARVLPLHREVGPSTAERGRADPRKGP